MKKYNKIIVLCLAALILIQGTGLVVNFQEKRILAEKLDKVDTLLSETGDLLENVNTVMENVGTVISKLSLFK